MRLRVSAGGRLLSDVGGPYVLAPVSAPLRLDGRKIGSIVLSIQDDEGYKRLAGRLAGLDVLMYMDPAHPSSSRTASARAPGRCRPAAPTSTADTASACSPSTPPRSRPGPLVIRVLVPIPYS